MAKGKKEEKKEEKGEKKAKKEKKEVTPFQTELQILFVVVLAILFILSYANAAGVFGSLLSNLAFGLFGFLAYLLPFFLIGITGFYLANKENIVAKKKLICVACISVILIALMQLFTYHYDENFQVAEFYKKSAQHRMGGGLVGGLVANSLAFIFGEIGAYVILCAMLVVAFMYMTKKLIFQTIRNKSSKAYYQVKEKVANAAEERAIERAQTEELDELEDWEKDEKSSKRKAKFFTFKKASKDKGENKEPAVAGMEEIKPEPIEGAQEGEQKVDDLDFLTIQREGSEEKKVNHKHPYFPDDEPEVEGDFNVDVPIFQQEIAHKFDVPVRKEAPEQEEKMQTASAKEMTVQQEETLFDTIEEGLEHFVDVLTIEKGETKEGVVMDAVAVDGAVPLPEDVVTRLSAPVQTAETKQEAKNAQAVRMKNTSGENVGAIEEPVIPNGQIVPKKYQFPTSDLLIKPEKQQDGMSDERLKENARKLQSTLESFGVGAKVVNVSCGPSVTRFELQPEQGVKVSKITALSDDIKLNMAAEEIRIEAPIPGKAAVGIEIPNEATTMVHLRDLVENSQFKKHKSNIAFAVGKDIGGQVVVTDIAKMPHLLIAGATGSGKSVCINTLIMSILYKAHPDDVKLIMIDPKVVELSCYNGIPHLLIPVVTDPKKASGALQWAVQEMSERYKKFADLSVREIKGYNDKIKAVEYAKDERYKKMPQIVIIVDELADLMMVASKEVEDAICRLAQLARAAGIHLVIATQRPSVNVITGLIKANVPSRIAFAVSSAIDSRTILDGGGAEKLLGKGDMLFYPSGFPKPVRVQGAFVSDQEVNAVVEFITKQNIVQYDQAVDEKISSAKLTSDGEKGGNSGNDDYFEEAGRFIIEKNKASIGMLQRVYKIGFNRAARIMDQLCAAGVVGPEEGTKPRKVIMTIEEFEEYISG